MPSALNQPAIDLLNQPVIASFVTLNPDGSPQITPVWVDYDGKHVLVNTAEGRKKPRNLHADPRVALQVVDPANPWGVLAFQGKVVAIDREGADAHIDKLAKKYMGKESYPFRNRAEQRVIIRIEPVRILMQPS